VVSSVDEAIEKFVSYKKATFTPNEENVRRYAEVYSIWQGVYNATKEISHELTDFNAEVDEKVAVLS
jgi:sugar (pentulose or hexulose) kinase